MNRQSVQSLAVLLKISILTSSTSGLKFCFLISFRKLYLIKMWAEFFSGNVYEGVLPGVRVYLYLCVGVLAFILCIYICVCPRLAEECASDPLLKENAFTAPSRHGDAQDSLESLCQCLLRCCDSVWIPTVIVRAHSTDARVRFIIELSVKKLLPFCHTRTLATEHLRKWSCNSPHLFSEKHVTMITVRLCGTSSKLLY